MLFRSVAEAEALAPTHLCVSPGPGAPADAGVSMRMIEHFAGRIPVFGVCLGHQAIVEVFGGRVVRAPRLMHGKTSPIEHDGKTLFHGLPRPFAATRYHSLVVERDGKAADPFNRLPAWENIASLHLAANREWAFWSPRGYYAASANGDTLFGWLVNRGVDRLPRFFRANQFRRRLERPDVMSRLLAAGSLGAKIPRIAISACCAIVSAASSCPGSRR